MPSNMTQARSLENAWKASGNNIDYCDSSVSSGSSDESIAKIEERAVDSKQNKIQESNADIQFKNLALKTTASTINYMLRLSRCLLRGAMGAYSSSTTRSGIGSSTTVLVTTGRQAKTLHTVRALKAVGCRVIVSDFNSISTSAVSVDCDAFVSLPPLTSEPHDWIAALRRTIEQYDVNMVVPVSTINEVLLMAFAKDELSTELPGVRWICPGLEDALALDDRIMFSLLCDKHEIPAPISGLLSNREHMQDLSERFQNGVIFKRVESTVNRAEEVVPVRAGEEIPCFIQPTVDDPWQWQEFVTGVEMSVWYLCIDGVPCFSACYNSEADLTHFDPSPVPTDLDIALRRLIATRRLTGQYAFDFIVDEHNVAKVIECNPRSSSILETVSGTPNWGEAFFGIDVTQRTVRRSVGFLYHKNCWPWSSREEGHFQVRDPLPIIAAQVAWPMDAIASKSSTSGEHKIDTNICKIIVKGQSAGRNIPFFKNELQKKMISFAEKALICADTLLLDVSIDQAEQVAMNARERGTNVILLHCKGTKNFVEQRTVDVIAEDMNDSFFQQYIQGETRALLGEKLSRACGSIWSVSYRIVTKNKTLHHSSELPLRQRRVLHVIGSRSSEFYGGVSKLYGFQCMEYFHDPEQYEHFVAYIHRSGEWSIGRSTEGAEHFESQATKMNVGDAVQRIRALGVDAVLPHMFDYLGMTSYRSLFDVLELPIIGCTGEAMALSTNKVQTKAVAATSKVPVAEMEVLVEGQLPVMSLPFIIKPVEEDNSLGVSLVRNQAEVKQALENGFRVDEKVMCERYIELGRELRVAVLENANGELEMLPILEYLLPASSPIRGVDQKLATDKSGVPNGLPKKRTQLPAAVDSGLYGKLWALATNAHRSLGCRDYSIYDVRVDPQGEPFMLESCLYCSFSPNSVIVTMARAAGVSPQKLLMKAIDWTIARRTSPGETSEGIGMKA